MNVMGMVEVQGWNTGHTFSPPQGGLGNNATTARIVREVPTTAQLILKGPGRVPSFGRRANRFLPQGMSAVQVQGCRPQGRRTRGIASFPTATATGVYSQSTDFASRFRWLDANNFRGRMVRFKGAQGIVHRVVGFGHGQG